MRTFLVSFALVLFVAPAPNPALTPQRPPTPGGLPEIVQPAPQRRGDTVGMWRRAEIKVVPMDLVAADQAELRSLRDRIQQAEAEMAKLARADPALRQQFSRDLALMRALLQYAQQQNTDRGKSPTALAVQKHLNHIEGQMMCEACHTRVIAQNGAGRGVY